MTSRYFNQKQLNPMWYLSYFYAAVAAGAARSCQRNAALQAARATDEA